MSERNQQVRQGRFQKPDDEQAIRKRRVTMVFGLILTTAAMIAFIEYGQISYILAMCFNAALAAMFGYHIK